MKVEALDTFVFAMLFVIGIVFAHCMNPMRLPGSELSNIIRASSLICTGHASWPMNNSYLLNAKEGD